MRNNLTLIELEQIFKLEQELDIPLNLRFHHQLSENEWTEIFENSKIEINLEDLPSKGKFYPENFKITIKQM